MNSLVENLEGYKLTPAMELAVSANDLFSLPDIYLRLLRLVSDDRSSVEDIAELISLDAALAGRLLKMANSSFYNFPAQVDTVPRAITLIGSKELCNLVLATSVASSFKGVPQNLIDMDSFWRHNVDTGLIARHMGKLAGVHDVERFFTVGLLHNIGKLLVLIQDAESASSVIRKTESSLPWHAEEEVLGFTFAECGAELMKLWHLPEVLTDAVANQHEPQSAKVDVLTASLLHISSRAASALEQEVNEVEGPEYLELIDPAAWECCGLEDSDLEASIAFAQAEAWNILGLVTSSLY